MNCAESLEERQLRHLHHTTLQRLCLFAALPAAVLPPLVTITKHAMHDLRKDHKKLLRMLYYHIHLILGCGRAGTNGAKDAEEVSAAMLPPNVMEEYWQTFGQTTKDVAQLVANLHVLSGLLRGFRMAQPKNKQKAHQGPYTAIIKGMIVDMFDDKIAAMTPAGLDTVCD